MAVGRPSGPEAPLPELSAGFGSEGEHMESILSSAAGGGQENMVADYDGTRQPPPGQVRTPCHVLSGAHLLRHRFTGNRSSAAGTAEARPIAARDNGNKPADQDGS